MFSVAIVGAGPAGFYAVEALKRADPEITVDIYERLPAPFGLARYGIAPDHPRLKAPIQFFERIATMAGVRYFGDVEVGRDVELSELRSAYSAVIVTYGAQEDETLDLPGAPPGFVKSAREFVSWYNGIPDFPADAFDLQKSSVVVIGNGNVAIDIARIVSKPVQDLEATDICDRALTALRQSRVKQVHLVGRRGPVQARFTTKELRELGELRDVSLSVDPGDLELGQSCAIELGAPGAEVQRKNLELLGSWAQRPGSEQSARRLSFHFRYQPESVETNSKGERSLVLRRLRLHGPAHAQLAEPSEGVLRLPCDLLIASIGFRVGTLPGLLSAGRTGIPNQAGRVLAGMGQIAEGLYVAGWAKRGPSGVLGTNRPCAEETVRSMMEDRAHWRRVHEPEINCITEQLVRKGVRVIDWPSWLFLDQHEKERGVDTGRPRVKFQFRAEIEEVLGLSRQHP